MIYLSLGSNIGNRLNNLALAISFIKNRFLQNSKCSIVIETEAILPFNGPLDWNKPFLNMIIAGETSLSPYEILQELKNIEKEMGRPQNYEKWSPRVIDLDILYYNDLVIDTYDLIIPHPQLEHRDFFKHLLALMGKEPWKSQPNINSIFLKSFVVNPQLVGIVNITKDSFSDGGNFFDLNNAINQVANLIEDGASVIEIGAQSTRPGAIIQAPESEYAKLDELLKEITPIITREKINISVDTFHPLIAIKLLEKYDISLINDVKGSFDDVTLKIIAEAGCKFCLMHSITVPPSKNEVIPLNLNPIEYLIRWGESSIEKLVKLGFSLKNVILDPGIGFGKSFYQNIEILKSIESFRALGCLIMAGHSRKSYIQAFSNEKHANLRDIETIAISLSIKNKVDFLRVHNVKDHMKALVAHHICNV